MRYLRLVEDGCFIPLLANSVGLPLTVPSRSEEFFGNSSAELALQSRQFERLSGETFDGLSWCIQI
jgi:hypothetical protein